MLLIIVNGLPATGKSTLAGPLSRDLQIPLIAKDTIKEFLFETLGVRDRSWSNTLGKASNDFLYQLTDILLTDGQSIMIENAFEISFAKPKLQEIIDTHRPDVLEIYCYTSPSVRKQRFIARNESGDRHKGHADHENYEQNAGPEPTDKYAPLELGYFLRIDTTESPDCKKVISLIHELGII